MTDNVVQTRCIWKFRLKEAQEVINPRINMHNLVRHLTESTSACYILICMFKRTMVSKPQSHCQNFGLIATKKPIVIWFEQLNRSLEWQFTWETTMSLKTHIWGLLGFLSWLLIYIKSYGQKVIIKFYYSIFSFWKSRPLLVYIYKIFLLWTEFMLIHMTLVTPYS